MKSILTTTCLFIGLGLTQAQSIKSDAVPTAVKDAFAKKYPSAKVDKWEKEGAGFEAEFHVNKIENSVVMDANGNLLETEVEISPEQLPTAVKDYIAKNLPGKKAKEASKITDAKGTVTYEAEINEVDYIFDANGSFMKKEEEGKDQD